MGATSLQALPTTAVDPRPLVVQIARTMLRMVGAGWQAPQDSLNAADALAFATSYTDLRDELMHVWNQAFVAYATSDNGLLTEWERLLAIPVDTTLSDATRQTRLLAFVRSAIDGSPESIASAVSAVTGTCEIVEFTAAEVWLSDPSPTAATRRGVFRFVVVIPLAMLTDPSVSATVAAVVERMKPAHTDYTIAAKSPAAYDMPEGYDLSVYGV